MQKSKTKNLSEHDFDLSPNGTYRVGIPMYYFLLLFNSNVRPHSPPLRYTSLQSQSGLDCNLSRSVKVKCDGAVAVLIHEFLFVSNNNIWPNWTSLRDISLQNLRGLDLDFQGHLTSNVMVPLDSLYMIS